MEYSQDNYGAGPPPDSDYDSPAPFSGRTGKKKSALAKLAAHKSKNRVQPSDDSDLGSKLSLSTRTESFFADMNIRDETSMQRSYPVDADVRVRYGANHNEDSDEGIEVSSSGVHSRLSNGQSGAIPDLSHRNRFSTNVRASSSLEKMDISESHRIDKESSLLDSTNDMYRPTPSARLNSAKRFRDQNSSGEEFDRDSGRTRVRKKSSETDQRKSNKTSNNRSEQKSSTIDKDSGTLSNQHLGNAMEVNEDDVNSGKSSDVLSDEDKLAMLPIQGPSASGSPMMSSRESPQRYGRGTSLGLDATPLSARHSPHIKNDLGRPWSATLKSSQHYDTMSHHSFASTSVLPLISTQEARSRSFLFGSTNSRWSLLGAEELERYFPDRRVRIFVCTWNMYEMKDPPKTLDNLLLPDSVEYVQDFYVITSQESVRNREEWKLRLQESLGPSHVLFHFAEHGALVIAILIRRDLFWFCSAPEEGRVTTSPSLKTKGALGVAFTFFGTSFLFINSHFTAHDGKTKERIEDYNKIIEGLNLPRKWDQPRSKSQVDVTSRFDCVFWSGDLNFRLELSRDRVDNVVKGIQAKEFPNYEDLVMNGDQLFKVQNEGLAFQQFQEGRIKFRPTYKHDVGTETYDTSSKMRIPSYTDRILFRSKKKNAITCMHYDSVESMKESDHWAVYGLFETTIRPGKDSTPLALKFDIDVYKEANRRRALHLETVSALKRQKNSSVCSIQ